MRIAAFLFLFAIVDGLEPLTIAGLIGMGLASGYAYVRPNFYYRGNLEVCISGNGNHQADPWLGLTTCMAPGFRITLPKKVHFQEKVDGTSSDGKSIRLNVDCILYSPNLEEYQLLLAERFVDDESFKETVIYKPIRFCLQNYMSQTLFQTMKSDKVPNNTYQEIIATCMEEYETTFVPMKNTYAAVR
jgi:hypothetical protein